MKPASEGKAGPSSSTQVLHLVGGLNPRGGLMSYVRSITQERLPGFEQFVWKHRQYPPENDHNVCLGWSKKVDLAITDDIVGAILDLIPLYLWLRKRKGIIVHAHTRMGTILSALISVVRCVPVVVYTHARWRQTACHRLMWRVTRATVIFNSRMTCLHFGFVPEKSHILPPTIQWPAMPPKGTPRFVASSQILRWKNVHLVVEAFLQMAQETQSLHIYGFSKDPPEPDYQDEIVRLARPHANICLHPWDSNWTNSLCGTDIFVHAAIGEPFGIVLLEAYARGCRIVAPHGTFLDELPSAGVFQSVLNSSALAQAMSAAVASPCSNDLWRERQSVAPQFSIENTMEKLAEIYRAKLRSNRPAEVETPVGRG